jgi:glycosyltransferase involved in cell wall biosynthesis
MPTLAAAERGPSLRRAIASVLAQESVIAHPLVVVNGEAPDPAVLSELRANPRIRLIEIERAGISSALEVGRQALDTRWFAELDDDDLLLPGALAIRMRALESRPDCDIVVTNGYRRSGTADVLHTRDGGSVRRDPLRALLEGNWLLPGSWLCRTDSVDPSIFVRMPAFLECTYLAVRFALTERLTFLDIPTVVWTANGGESRSAPYRLGEPAALEQILTLDLPADFRAGLRRHLRGAYHSVAELHRLDGRPGPAWRAHVASLRLPGGWRHLAYTRRLIGSTIGRAFNGAG